MSKVNFKFETKNQRKLITEIEVNNNSWTYNKTPLFDLSFETFKSLFIDNTLNKPFSDNQLDSLVEILYSKYEIKCSNLRKVYPLDLNSNNFKSKELNTISSNNPSRLKPYTISSYIKRFKQLDISVDTMFYQTSWIFENLISNVQELPEEFKLTLMQYFVTNENLTEGQVISELKHFNESIGYYNQFPQDYLHLLYNRNYILNLFTCNLINSDLFNWIETTKEYIDIVNLKTTTRYLDTINSTYLPFYVEKIRRYGGDNDLISLHDKGLIENYYLINKSEDLNTTIINQKYIKNLRNISNVKNENELCVASSEMSNKPCLDIFDNDKLHVQLLSSINRNSYISGPSSYVPLNTEKYQFDKSVMRNLKLGYLENNIELTKKYVKRKQVEYLEQIKNLYSNNSQIDTKSIINEFAEITVNQFNKILSKSMSKIEANVLKDFTEKFNETFLKTQRTISDLKVIQRKTKDFEISEIIMLNLEELNTLNDYELINTELKTSLNKIKVPVFVLTDTISGLNFIVLYNSVLPFTLFKPFNLIKNYIFELELNLNNQKLHQELISLIETIENKENLFSVSTIEEISSSIPPFKGSWNFEYYVLTENMDTYSYQINNALLNSKNKDIIRVIEDEFSVLNFNKTLIPEIIWNSLESSETSGLNYEDFYETLRLIETGQETVTDNLEIKVNTFSSNILEEFENVRPEPNRIKNLINRIFYAPLIGQSRRYYNIYIIRFTQPQDNKNTFNLLTFSSISDPIYSEFMFGSEIKYNNEIKFEVDPFIQNLDSKQNSELVMKRVLEDTNIKTKFNKLFNSTESKSECLAIQTGIKEMFNKLTNNYILKTKEGLVYQNVSYFNKLLNIREGETGLRLNAFNRTLRFLSKAVNDLKYFNTEINTEISNESQAFISLETLINRTFLNDENYRNSTKIKLITGNKILNNLLDSVLNTKESLTVEITNKIMKLFKQNPTLNGLIIEIEDSIMFISDLNLDVRENSYQQIGAIYNLLTKQSREKLTLDSDGNITNITSNQRLPSSYNSETMMNWINAKNLLEVCK